ncbi:hypothetical protein LP419_03550 [Massilia sp. H-1]|nr:hypothetical protein LP419_03550 [Massilia sp. H-1]
MRPSGTRILAARRTRRERGGTAAGAGARQFHPGPGAGRRRRRSAGARCFGHALSPLDFVRLAAPLAQALAQLHRCELVHQDLRPEHILVGTGPDARVALRLTGFGCTARLAR